MSKKHIVVLTGAGISADSGLKTFRDADGLWEGYDINEVATIDAWHKNPQLVLDFYNLRREQALQAQPNPAHIALAQFEQDAGVIIITQNVDDLHERAGSSKVIHLHGSLQQLKSEKNDHIKSPWNSDIKLGDLAEDGHQLRPDIVWFGEAVPMIETAAGIVAQADILIIVGTSLVVYPAAGLIFNTPPFVPIYVCDKTIPFISCSNTIHKFAESAKTGVPKLLNQIKNIL